jgi:hypothetical protein
MTDIKIVIVFIVWAIFGSLFTSMILLADSNNDYNMPNSITYTESAIYQINDKTQNMSSDTLGLNDIKYDSVLGVWGLSPDGLHVLNMPSYAVCYYGSKSCYNGIIYENFTFNDTDFVGYDDRFTVFESPFGNLELRLYDGKFTVDRVHSVFGIETSRIPKFTGIALSDTLGSMTHKIMYYYYMYNDTLYLSYDDFGEPDFIVIRDAFGTKNYIQTDSGKIDLYDAINRTSQCRVGTNSYNLYIHSSYNIFSINQILASSEISASGNDAINLVNSLTKIVTLSVPDEIIPVWLQFLMVDLPLIGLLLWGVALMAGIIP